jgi:hypothetical protein
MIGDDPQLARTNVISLAHPSVCLSPLTVSRWDLSQGRISADDGSAPRGRMHL